MSSVGNIEIHFTASAPKPSAKAPAESMPGNDRANAPRAAAVPQDGAEKDSDRAVIDEPTLDRMALRLYKRDPGLSIEKDEIVRGYVYRFVDPESGDQVGQFPADKVLETMRALHEIAERLSTEEKGSGIAV
jgi:uncharacterized FlaG/YvyC family protein